ncbi:MAG TPA: dTDP-glucose 4,6-dehydratase [Rhodothermia bacterium]|nr:dTDP-glucose 4,6-dehydratase [Rhodothermia bacterium]
MRRILVTGGAGFIGANFVHYCLKSHPGDRLVVLDALTYAGNMASLTPAVSRPEFRFVHGSIGDTDLVTELLRSERLDTIVHFAAESHVDRSISGPDVFIETNIVGTHSVLKAARRVWLQERAVEPNRFHHVSTDEVYGSLGADDPRFTERTPYAPNSPYSASKAGSDHLVRAYHHTYGLDVTISNCSNNYGPYQFPEKLIPLMIINALLGKPLPIYGDGLNVRDWLHVRDHCKAIDLTLRQGCAGQTYNVGGNSERTNLHVVTTVCQAIDGAFVRDPSLAQRFPDCPAAVGGSAGELVMFVTDRPGHDRRYAIDATLIQEELGLIPSQSFETGLHETVNWYLTHEAWWSAILRGEHRAYEPSSIEATSH